MDYDSLMDVNYLEFFPDEYLLDPFLFDAVLPEIEFRTDDEEVERVGERIRQLQGVTDRSEQRKRRRCDPSSLGGSVVYTDVEGGIVDETDRTGTAEKKKESGCGMENSDLVGKALASALAMDSPAKKRRVKEGGSFYDCNICFELARDPVLTCCGHLFCWGCFYQVGYVDSSSKECPVCKGDVSDGNVTPIYGNGDGESDCEAVPELKLPPRPKARRVERVRHSD